MKKERVYNLFKDLLYLIEQEEPEEEETPVEGEETEEIEDIEEVPPTEDEGEEPIEGSEEDELPEEDEEAIDTEEQLSTVDKVYRLKKIYAKLIAISRLLEYHSDEKYDTLRDEVLEAIDLFHIIVSNFDSFKDKIDDIIKSYYKLLQSSIEELERLSNSKE